MGKNTAMRESIPLGDGSFFARDKGFYRTLFGLSVVLVLQNLITYSVNVADNLMLGVYSQTALAGAAAINQIQYILQQFTIMGVGEGLVVLASQYWGQGNTKAVQRLAGIGLCVGIAAGAALTLAAFVCPAALAGIFTDDAAVAGQAVEYLSVMRYTYVIFIVTNLLLVTLRSVQVVGIAFLVSCITLVVNVCANYVLIFGRFGAPELGIRGAAVGTLIARGLEFLIVLLYCRRKSLPVRLRPGEMLPLDKGLFGDFIRISVPCVVSAILFSSAVAIQTAIFGHISSDALAAVSASSTFFQYCKMIPSSMAAATSVLIAKTVGMGDYSRLRSYVRTFQALFLGVGLLVGGVLLCIRNPVLDLYAITPLAREYAGQMMLILAAVALVTSYQMPCQIGIIRGGGDTRFVMISDLIYSWVFTVPLGLLAAFVWRWPFWAVAVCLNCDQFLKCFTAGVKVNRYTWVKKLTGTTAP